MQERIGGHLSLLALLIAVDVVSIILSDVDELIGPGFHMFGTVPPEAPVNSIGLQRYIPARHPQCLKSVEQMTAWCRMTLEAQHTPPVASVALVVFGCRVAESVQQCQSFVMRAILSAVHLKVSIKRLEARKHVAHGVAVRDPTSLLHVPFRLLLREGELLHVRVVKSVMFKATHEPVRIGHLLAHTSHVLHGQSPDEAREMQCVLVDTRQGEIQNFQTQQHLAIRLG